MKPPASGNHGAGGCSVAKAEIESPSIAGTYIIGLFDILGQTHKLRDLPSFLAPPGTPARAEATSTLSCTAPGSLDTYLCYAAWRSSYSSRASIGV